MSLRECGFSFVELLVAVALAGLVVGGAGTFLSAQASGAARTREVADRLEVVRAARTVLHEELRASVPGRDRARPAGDSLVLRAFRGVALGCGDGGAEARDDDGTLVHYLGPRLPDPEKDSLLVLEEGGGWRAVPLEARSPAPDAAAPCPGGGPGWRLERWTVPEREGPLRVGRVFERGSYHVADGALRYRAGAGEGGRQPLTPALLDDAASGIGATGEGEPVRLRLRFRRERPDRPGRLPAAPGIWTATFWPPLP